MWTYELSSWLCDEPAVGARVPFADLADAQRTLRWLLSEDPLARMQVAALLRDLDDDRFAVAHASEDEHALIERTAWLLERGRLVLHRSVEIMASEIPTRDYRQEYEPPVNAIVEIETWMFWDEFRPMHTLELEAKHVGEPSFVLGEEDGPVDGFVLDAELAPADTLGLEAEDTDGNFVLAVEDELGDERRSVAGE